MRHEASSATGFTAKQLNDDTREDHCGKQACPFAVILAHQVKGRVRFADTLKESAIYFRGADRSVVVMSKIGLLAVVLLVILVSLTGCMSVRYSGFVIPARCVRVSVQSFTRPCIERRDGKFVCDGVVITASCVAPPVTASVAQ